MIHTLESVRVFARTAREARVSNAALLGASAALDTIAAAILLGAVTLPASIATLVAATMHASAILLLSGVSGVTPSRLRLCLVATLVVPCAGAAVALTLVRTRGRGTARKVLSRPVRRRRIGMAEIERLATALSPCDALESGDEDERRTALSALSRDGGPAAIALLRQATSHPDPDVALSAALVLDEIGARAERRSAHAGTPEDRRVAR